MRRWGSAPGLVTLAGDSLGYPAADNVHNQCVPLLGDDVQLRTNRNHREGALDHRGLRSLSQLAWLPVRLEVWFLISSWFTKQSHKSFFDYAMPVFDDQRLRAHSTVGLCLLYILWLFVYVFLKLRWFFFYDCANVFLSTTFSRDFYFSGCVLKIWRKLCWIAMLSIFLMLWTYILVYIILKVYKSLRIVFYVN